MDKTMTDEELPLTGQTADFSYTLHTATCHTKDCENEGVEIQIYVADEDENNTSFVMCGACQQIIDDVKLVAS